MIFPSSAMDSTTLGNGSVLSSNSTRSHSKLWISDQLATKSWWWFWGISLFAKLALAFLLPLSNDEAYYRVWGMYPQLSYYDHPPIVGWLFSLGLMLPGAEAWPGLTRWPAVLAGHLTWLIWNEILRPSTTPQQRLWVLVVLLLSPFFGLGSLIVTPDLPLIMTWTLALYGLQRFAVRPSLWGAAAVGSSMGLAFCAKYHAVLLAPIALFFLYFSSAFRTSVLSRRIQQFFMAFACGILFCAPVLLWNYQNDWISFRFQLSHGLEVRAPQLHQVVQQVGEYVLGQFALLSPIVWFWAWRREHPRSLNWLHFVSWPILLFFLWSSTRSHVEANWPIIAHFPLLTLGTIQLIHSSWGRRVLAGTLLFWLILSALAVHQAFYPRTVLLGIPAQNHKTFEFVRFEEILPALNSEALNNRATYASSYQMAADLTLRSGKLICKISGYNRRDFFDFLPTCHPLKNSDVGKGTGLPIEEFQVIVDDEGPWPNWIAENGFVRLGEQRLTERYKLVKFKRESGQP